MKTPIFILIALIVGGNSFAQPAELPDTLQVGKHTVAEWNYIIDTTWGEGRTTEEKLQILDIFWDYADQHSVDFINNPIDWDSVRTAYRPRVEAGVSRGEFNGIMQRMLYALKNNHNFISDTAVVTTPPLNGTPIVLIGCSGVNTLSDQSHFGAALTPLEDSSAVVFRAAENHPLGLEPGDRVLGYEGIPWKDLYPLLIQMKFPFSSYFKIEMVYGMLWHGSTNASDTHRWLRSSGLNWHLFDTIDIIKYGQTDTLHLPTSLMNGYNSPIPGNEQLPVNGIELPGSVDDGSGYFLSTIPIRWGIMSGTNIGYIYVSYWLEASELFLQAINELIEQEVEGLIIDYRLNYGGSARFFHPGYKRLFNNYALTTYISLREDPNDHFLLGEPLNPLVFDGDNYLFDRPIALITGPGAHSGGDASTYILTHHPMTRSFGKWSNGAHTAVYDTDGTDVGFPEWEMTVFKRMFWYDTPDGPVQMVHRELPVDFPVWHTTEAVRKGEDAVVNTAVDWIHNVSHSYNFTLQPELNLHTSSSINLTAVISNPQGHNLEVRAQVENSLGEIVDSLQLVSTGIEGAVLEGDTVWSASLDLEDLFLEEDLYKVILTSSDLTTQTHFSPAYPSMICSAGPVEAVIESLTWSNDNRYKMSLSLSNNGTLKSIPMVNVILESLNELCSVHSSTPYYGNIHAGEQISKNIYIDFGDVQNGDTLRFETRIYSGEYHHWTDTLEYVVTEIPDITDSYFSNDVAVRIYPNPTGDVINIATDDPDPKSVILTTVHGQVILNKEMEGSDFQIDLSSHGKGVYLIRISNDEYSVVEKVIKIN